MKGGQQINRRIRWVGLLTLMPMLWMNMGCISRAPGPFDVDLQGSYIAGRYIAPNQEFRFLLPVFSTEAAQVHETIEGDRIVLELTGLPGPQSSIFGSPFRKAWGKDIVLDGTAGLPGSETTNFSDTHSAPTGVPLLWVEDTMQLHFGRLHGAGDAAGAVSLNGNHVFEVSRAKFLEGYSTEYPSAAVVSVDVLEVRGDPARYFRIDLEKAENHPEDRYPARLAIYGLQFIRNNRMILLSARSRRFDNFTGGAQAWLLSVAGRIEVLPTGEVYNPSQPTRSPATDFWGTD